MKVISLILCLFVSYVTSKGCNLPPSAWCSSPEIAELCQATDVCQQYLNPAPEAPKVNVSLYYESLCPFSIRFIVGELARAYKAVSPIMNLELIPFGNANIKTSHGLVRFKCQHGPLECQANIVETCAINKLPQTEAYQFIYCVSKQIQTMVFPSTAYKRCARSMKIDINPLLRCGMSEEGMKLEKVMGTKTNNLDPPKTYVPWVVVNGEHTEKLNNEAQSDLVGLVCSLYKGSDKPTACTK